MLPKMGLHPNHPSHYTILVLKPAETYCDLGIPHDLSNLHMEKRSTIIHISLMWLGNSQYPLAPHLMGTRPMALQHSFAPSDNTKQLAHAIQASTGQCHTARVKSGPWHKRDSGEFFSVPRGHKLKSVCMNQILLEVSTRACIFSD